MNTALKALCLLALVGFSGCGIDWFPKVTPAPTPNAFSFTSKFGVPLQGQISSNTVTISGFANNSTAGSVSISSGSAFSINGVRATSLTGTVKNKDLVKVYQTASSVLGGTQVSTLTIGTQPGTFTTVTQTMATPTFTASTNPTPPANTTQITTGLLNALDSGGHNIRMSGNTTSFAVTDANNGDVISFTSSTATFPILSLANHHILLRIPSGATGTTSLTVDATTYVIDNTTFAVTTLPQ
ncbi:hypothetical protein GMLC_40580 [Geomonas limicola]|uniref:Lipoprotein n=1 Tax=Geomonas limicola TaxID=2740186 RepID=A0A6V8NHS9_9BACT|nr:hypothetical protein [Geomonas limicola]GFO70479.1 hypothetical protein GMLC_40580 [Geomonas limicola]